MATSSKKQQANFFISMNIIADLKKNVPARQQSVFVEEAISKALRDRNFSEVLDEVAGAWKAKDHPEDTEKFIRSLRESKRL